MATRTRKGPAKAGPGPFGNDPSNPPIGPACPHCGSADTYELSYGHPGHDVIAGHEPRWWCRPCERGWGRLDDQAGSPWYFPFWFGEPPRDDVDAAARLLVRYRLEAQHFQDEPAKYEARFLRICDQRDAVLARAEAVEAEEAEAEAERKPTPEEIKEMADAIVDSFDNPPRKRAKRKVAKRDG